MSDETQTMTPAQVEQRLDELATSVANHPEKALDPLAPELVEALGVGSQMAGQVDRIGTEARARTRRIYLAMLAGLAVGLGAFQFVSTRDEQRDTAQRYQRCIQNARGAVGSNITREVTQNVAAKLEDLTDAIARRTTYEDLQRASLALSLAANEAVSLQLRQPIPDCDGTYPEGRELADKFGDQAPTLPAPTTAR